MRMWMVSPTILCRQHLLGEHRELHALVGIIRRGISLQGYLDNGLIETDEIANRHEELVLEMTRRGYNHHSPLEYDDSLRLGSVDDEENVRELWKRCNSCRERMQDATQRG